jgi:hypothetical protein
VRRGVAAAAIIVVIILIAVGVDSCQSSARKSALQDYANSVSSVITRSDNTSAALFKTLSSGGGSSNGVSIQNQINQTRASAQTVLSDAQKQSAPDSVKTANSHLLLALRMRLDGITNIANEIQPALGSSVNKDAVDNIAGEMARFYASDVLYKSYTAPELVSALHANKIAVGGANGETINAGQFLPSIQWLDPAHIASALNVSLPGGSKSGKPAPGVHGHVLNSVSVNGTTLQSGATNSVTAKPAPTFTLSFTNGGTNNETDVKCKVSVTGTGVTGLKIVPQTAAGKSATCAVTLTAAPPAGTYSVVATIEKVPGESNTSNNSLTFPVTFN